MRAEMALKVANFRFAPCDIFGVCAVGARKVFLFQCWQCRVLDVIAFIGFTQAFERKQ
jgi:hypothetical protein